MGYRLDPRQPVAREVRRIADHQLELAIAALIGIGDAESAGAVGKARRRVKKVRALIRLVRFALGHRGRAVNREALDGCLGECHDCAILCDVVATDATLSPADAAHLLSLVRRYERELRRRACRLGTTVHQDTPERFVSRVRRLWRSARRTRRSPQRGTSWQRAA